MFDGTYQKLNVLARHADRAVQSVGDAGVVDPGHVDKQALLLRASRCSFRRVSGSDSVPVEFFGLGSTDGHQSAHGASGMVGNDPSRARQQGSLRHNLVPSFEVSQSESSQAFPRNLKMSSV